MQSFVISVYSQPIFKYSSPLILEYRKLSFDSSYNMMRLSLPSQVNQRRCTIARTGYRYVKSCKKGNFFYNLCTTLCNKQTAGNKNHLHATSVRSFKLMKKVNLHKEMNCCATFPSRSDANDNMDQLKNVPVMAIRYL